MKSQFKKFDEPIEWKLQSRNMWIPDRSMTSHFRCHNHDYYRIRARWKDATRALEFESILLKRLENATNLKNELFAISDENYEDDDPPLWRLDIGVASTVLSLSALGCVTIYSCNAGCFGDFHHAEYPMIIFYAKPEDAKILINAARKAGVGIGPSDGGGIIVWANDIWDMHKFAGKLIEEH